MAECILTPDISLLGISNEDIQERSGSGASSRRPTSAQSGHRAGPGVRPESVSQSCPCSAHTHSRPGSAHSHGGSSTHRHSRPGSSRSLQGDKREDTPAPPSSPVASRAHSPNRGDTTMDTPQPAVAGNETPSLQASSSRPGSAQAQ